MRTFLLVLFSLLFLGCGPRIDTPRTDGSSEVERLRREVNLLRRELDRCHADCSGALARTPERPRDPGPGYRERGITVEVLPTDVYFESGQSTLTTAGVQRLGEVVTRLRRTYPGMDIRVEGYTDTKPIGPNLRGTYPSNWELAAARAAAVVRHLQQTHGFDPLAMEAVSYGEFRPVAPNDSPEGRQQNRRVRIAVYRDQ